MQFVDLTDVNYDFSCEFSSDACEYWKYDFLVERWDDKYCKNLSQSEIDQLRINCKRILQAIEDC